MSSCKWAWLVNFTTTIINTTLWRSRLDICLRCKTFPVRSQPTTEKEKKEEMDHHVFVTSLDHPWRLTRTCLPPSDDIITRVHLVPCTINMEVRFSTPIGPNILLTFDHIKNVSLQIKAPSLTTLSRNMTINLFFRPASSPLAFRPWFLEAEGPGCTPFHERQDKKLRLETTTSGVTVWVRFWLSLIKWAYNLAF